MTQGVRSVFCHANILANKNDRDRKKKKRKKYNFLLNSVTIIIYIYTYSYILCLTFCEIALNQYFIKTKIYLTLCWIAGLDYFRRQIFFHHKSDDRTFKM